MWGGAGGVVPSYREYRPPPALAPVVACAWENEPADDHTQRIVPDGCIDLIWEAGRELVIAGPDTAARTVALPGRVLVIRRPPAPRRRRCVPGDPGVRAA